MKRMAKMRTDFLPFLSSVIVNTDSCLEENFQRFFFVIRGFSVIHVVFPNGTIRNLNIRGLSEDRPQYTKLFYSVIV